MNVETDNALMRERARIREAVIKLQVNVNEHIHGGEAMVKRSEVLKILHG